MDVNEELELKKEFQVERLIFFSDAVFAIIITIMVLDIKIPETPEAAKLSYLDILPKVSAYGFSFFAIGVFWVSHLRIFSFIKDYDIPLLAINLLFLFSVSLFPFGLSSFLSGSHALRHSWGLYNYFGVMSFTFFTQTLLSGYIVKNSDRLCIKRSDLDKVLRWKATRINVFILPLFVIVLFLTQYFAWNELAPVAAVLAYVIVVRRLKKKFYPGVGNNSLSAIFKIGSRKQKELSKDAEN